MTRATLCDGLIMDFSGTGAHFHTVGVAQLLPQCLSAVEGLKGQGSGPSENQEFVQKLTVTGIESGDGQICVYWRSFTPLLTKLTVSQTDSPLLVFYF